MTNAAAGPRGTLHFWHEGVIFIGSDITNEAHRHFTASLAFALAGVFRVRFDDSPWREMRGMLVAPNTRQQMDARGCRLVILQIDPESSAYAHVSGDLSHEHVIELSPDVVGRLRAGTEAFLGRADFQAAELWTFILKEVNGLEQMPRPVDRRVAHVLELLKRDLSSRTDVASLAAVLGLSPSRLVHLFNAQMGTSLRRYVLWLRLRHVVFCLAAGRSLTEASHDAGFADSAHLCRTFRSMFGLPLSSLFRSSGVELSVTLPQEPLSGPHGPYDRQRWALVSAGRRRRRRPSHAA